MQNRGGVSISLHSARQIGHRPNQAEPNFAQNALYKHDYDKEIALLTFLLDNLKRCAGRFPAEKAIEILESRLQHFKQRRKIRSGGIKKFPLIVKEVLAGRYRTHTGGYKSAVKVFVSRIIAGSRRLARRRRRTDNL